MKGEGDGERQQGNSERKITKGEGNEGALSFRKPQIFAFFKNEIQKIIFPFTIRFLARVALKIFFHGDRKKFS